MTTIYVVQEGHEGTTVGLYKERKNAEAYLVSKGYDEHKKEMYRQKGEDAAITLNDFYMITEFILK